MSDAGKSSMEVAVLVVLSVKRGADVRDLEVAGNVSFKDVKHRVEEMFGVPASAQKLLIRGKECTDKELVQARAKAGAGKKTRVMLVKRPNFKVSSKGAAGSRTATKRAKNEPELGRRDGSATEASAKGDSLFGQIESVRLLVGFPVKEQAASASKEGTRATVPAVETADTTLSDVAHQRELDHCEVSNCVDRKLPVPSDAAIAEVLPDAAEAAVPVAARSGSTGPQSVFELVIRHGKQEYVMACADGLETKFEAIQGQLAEHTGIPIKFHKLLCRGKVNPLDATLRSVGLKERPTKGGASGQVQACAVIGGNTAPTAIETPMTVTGTAKATLLFQQGFYTSENLLATLCTDANRATVLLTKAASVQQRLLNRVADAAEARAFIVSLNEFILVVRAHLDETNKSGVLPKKSSNATSAGDSVGTQDGGADVGQQVLRARDTAKQYVQDLRKAAKTLSKALVGRL
eukprot:INCI15748.1.p1 GENE.INCI15748.1~~INCI15748.1.p1  ORF type:complete len:463 (+),score=85.98 INCI15748.1:197-1585(+)